MTPMKDEVFSQPIKKQFEFDADVAAVFDDMLQRSVPFYKEVIQLTSRFAALYTKEGGRVYDLGCSTASQLLEIERSLEVPAELVGIDNAEAMLEQAHHKIDAFGSKIRVVNGDILTYPYETADVMISNYTLQFIRPLEREKLVEKICTTLTEGGAFIFSEKVISADKRLNKELIDCYYDFKKEQGYSTYEIAQKREALENVLVPYTEEENITMCRRSGFRHCEVLFRWANFATFIAIS
jgi:tRNA (cmo5U34)-methyltransferase